MPPASEIPHFENIRDSLDLIDPPVWFWTPLIIAIAIVVLALWFGIRWIRRRRRTRLESPPYLAAERLWRIEPDAMPVRELFRQLHAIVIQYLSARAGFPASSQTSPEILSSFAAAGFGDSQELRTFLADSDRARFSASQPASSSGRESVRQCRTIIGHVEAKRKRGRKGRRAI